MRIYYICRIRIHFDLIERDQDKPWVADPNEQGMQGGLFGHWP